MLSDVSKYQHYEANCAFLGYICIKDPVRAEVKGAIQECKTAGINVIMITGDSKETAVAVAKELDMFEYMEFKKKRDRSKARMGAKA